MPGTSYMMALKLCVKGKKKPATFLPTYKLLPGETPVWPRRDQFIQARAPKLKLMSKISEEEAEKTGDALAMLHSPQYRTPGRSTGKKSGTGKGKKTSVFDAEAVGSVRRKLKNSDYEGVDDQATKNSSRKSRTTANGSFMSENGGRQIDDNLSRKSSQRSPSSLVGRKTRSRGRLVRFTLAGKDVHLDVIWPEHMQNSRTTSVNNSPVHEALSFSDSDDSELKLPTSSATNSKKNSKAHNSGAQEVGCLKYSVKDSMVNNQMFHVITP